MSVLTIYFCKQSELQLIEGLQMPPFFLDVRFWPEADIRCRYHRSRRSAHESAC